MMKRQAMMTAIAATLISAGAVSAQAHDAHGHAGEEPPGMMHEMMGERMMTMMGQGMMGRGMMQMMSEGMGMMPTGGPAPSMLLRMREALELSDEQVSRLEEIRDRHGARSHAPGDSGMMEAPQNAAAMLEGDEPDLDAYEAELRDLADRMVEVHVRMTRAALEARDVLTDEQRARLSRMHDGDPR